MGLNGIKHLLWYEAHKVKAKWTMPNFIELHAIFDKHVSKVEGLVLPNEFKIEIHDNEIYVPLYLTEDNIGYISCGILEITFLDKTRIKFCYELNYFGTSLHGQEKIQNFKLYPYKEDK